MLYAEQNMAFKWTKWLQYSAITNSFHITSNEAGSATCCERKMIHIMGSWLARSRSAVFLTIKLKWSSHHVVPQTQSYLQFSTQTDLLSGLHLLSDILKGRHCSRNWISVSQMEEWGSIYLAGSEGKSYSELQEQHLCTCLPDDVWRSGFWNVMFFPEYRTMDKGQRPSKC